MKGDGHRERFVGTVFQNDIATIWARNKFEIYKSEYQLLILSYVPNVTETHMNPRILVLPEWVYEEDGL